MVFLAATKISGQDFHFTQFYSNKLYLAPSFAGVNIENRVITNYRNQWPGVNGYSTYSVSLDKYFYKYNSGLGVLYMQDRAGDGNMGLQHISLHYSYDFSVYSTFHIRPGISLNYVQRSIEFSRLYFSSGMTDNTETVTNISGDFGKERFGSLDVTTSAVAYSRNILLGASFDHLLQPNLSYLGSNERMPISFSLFSVYTIYRQGKLLKPVDETVSITGIVRGMRNFAQADVGLYWAKIPLLVGLWYRGIPVVNSDRGDALAFLAGLKLHKFTVGYSYDFPLSNLNVSKSYGAHEVSLAFEFSTQSKTRKRKMQKVPCPDL
jgi:type IX secretion system PorP/SprF family membrane protein